MPARSGGTLRGVSNGGRILPCLTRLFLASPASTGSGSPGAEDLRLRETRAGTPWRAWGPYLSERQWGTVREDYSDGGDAWSYFTHDQARSRAYRWGEDGLAGISDDKQRLCLALALWNERDPILKERLFGLTNAEGNHGEDVKEYYFYVDNVPTHSYQRYLYKYPQAEFPYNDLVAVNRERSRHEFEYELIDTGIFDAGNYFDVEVEHAKASPEDIFCRVTVHNRSAEAAVLHVLPTLWFRNTWSWGDGEPKPRIARVDAPYPVVRAEDHQLGDFYLYAAPGGGPAVLRQRDEHRARVRRRADHPLPQGRHRRPRHRTAPTPSTPTARAPRRPRASGCRCRAAARLRCWCG